MDPVTPPPIWRDCEGGGCPPCAHVAAGTGMCAMCGEVKPLHDAVVDGQLRFVVNYHQRQDLLAMIERGDFGGA